MPTGDDLLRYGRPKQAAPIAGLFPKQRAFFDDPAKLKAAVCGRRAGKTFACAVGLYEAALRYPRSQCPYVALSGVSARRIMWPVIEKMNEQYQLRLKLDSQSLVATLPENGSKIFCVGGDDHRKVEALRGAPYPRVIVDEAQSFPKLLLRYLCEDVLDAALMDYDGDMWLVGTPNAACVGHFYDLTTGANPEVSRVPTHHWTVLDNVYIPHAGEYLARKRLERNWAEDHPVYLREYMGHWVRDASSLVFRFDRARHLIAALPETHSGVIGVDLGASEASETMAFVTNLWAKHSRKVCTARATKHTLMIPSDGGDHLEKLLKDFPGVHHAVVDAGGLGKGYVEEWRRRWGLPVIPAEKRDKWAYVRLLNGELDKGTVNVLDGPETRPLVEELELLQWNEDRDDFDDRFADHAIDAWLYGWRECYAWGEPEKPDAGPAHGSPEWHAMMAAKAKERAIADGLRRAARENRRLYR